MAKSLQDQLRQAGLANHKQAVKARKAKNTKEKMQRKGVAVEDETAEIIAAQTAEKLAKDRELNQEKQRIAEAKAIQAQIVQLISMNTIEERGDESFQFQHHGHIKTLNVSEDVRTALVKGQLAIVGNEERLDLVPRKVADKIAERDKTWIILLNDASEMVDSSIPDEYAEYEIPDDLMW